MTGLASEKLSVVIVTYFTRINTSIIIYINVEDNTPFHGTYKKRVLRSEPCIYYFYIRYT